MAANLDQLFIIDETACILSTLDTCMPYSAVPCTTPGGYFTIGGSADLTVP